MRKDAIAQRERVPLMPMTVTRLKGWHGLGKSAALRLPNRLLGPRSIGFGIDRHCMATRRSVLCGQAA